MTTPSLSTLGRMSARDLKAYLTSLPGWRALRVSRNLSTASMSKADMFDAAVEILGLVPSTVGAPGVPPGAPGVPPLAPTTPAAPGEPTMASIVHARWPATPAIPATPATPEDDASEDDAPEDAAPAPDAPADPLASLRGILSPALLAEADSALSALLASTASAVREAEIFKAEAVRLANIAVSQGSFGRSTQEDNDAPKPKPAFVAPTRAPLVSIGSKPLREVLGIKSAGKAYDRIPVPVYASPEAMPLDPHFVWPEGSGLLLAAITRGEHVFLYGDAGTGKTTFGEQLSARTGRPYFAISFAGDKASFDLIGQEMPEAGSMVWRDGELLAAMQVPGCIISLEELGFARSELVAALLSALQGGFVNLAGRRVHVAPGVSFLATNNDDGTASRSGRYVGVRPVNGALLDRFGLRFEFTALSPERETIALLGRCPNLNPDVARRMVDFRKAVSAAVLRGEAEHGVGLRRLMAWGRHVAAGLPSAEGFLASVLNSTPADDREFYQQQAVALIPHARIDAAQAGTGSLDNPTQPDLPEAGDITPERHGFQPL